MRSETLFFTPSPIPGTPFKGNQVFAGIADSRNAKGATRLSYQVAHGLVLTDRTDVYATDKGVFLTVVDDTPVVIDPAHNMVAHTCRSSSGGRICSHIAAAYAAWLLSAGLDPELRGNFDAVDFSQPGMDLVLAADSLHQAMKQAGVDKATLAAYGAGLAGTPVRDLTDEAFGRLGDPARLAALGLLAAPSAAAGGAAPTPTQAPAAPAAGDPAQAPQGPVPESEPSSEESRPAAAASEPEIPQPPAAAGPGPAPNPAAPWRWQTGTPLDRLPFNPALPDELEALVPAEKLFVEQDGELAMAAVAILAGQNLLLAGDAGCGKTTLLEFLAWWMHAPFITVPCSINKDEDALLGFRTKEGDEFVWVDGQVTFAVRSSKEYITVLYFDEIGAADPAVMVMTNELFDHRRALTVEMNGEVLHAPLVDDTRGLVLAASGNFGDGYTAAGRMDDAQLDRWCVIQMDYLKRRETATLLVSLTGVDQPIADLIARLGADLRELRREGKILCPVTTRSQVQVASLMKAGLPGLRAVRMGLVDKIRVSSPEEARIVRDAAETLFKGV